ncbi:IS3 family transposase [Weissella paramesenteroides]|uniref:IS3 family transposase n=1 Tax=Weissella paramesenteroides TaxID=1249 RepID=UPI003F747812
MKNYASAQELVNQINSWLNYYNNQRIQTKLGGKSPREFDKLPPNKQIIKLYLFGYTSLFDIEIGDYFDKVLKE